MSDPAYPLPPDASRYRLNRVVDTIRRDGHRVITRTEDAGELSYTANAAYVMGRPGWWRCSVQVDGRSTEITPAHLAMTDRELRRVLVPGAERQ